MVTPEGWSPIPKMMLHAGEGNRHSIFSEVAVAGAARETSGARAVADGPTEASGARAVAGAGATTQTTSAIVDAGATTETLEEPAQFRVLLVR